MGLIGSLSKPLTGLYLAGLVVDHHLTAIGQLIDAVDFQPNADPSSTRFMLPLPLYNTERHTLFFQLQPLQHLPAQALGFHAPEAPGKCLWIPVSNLIDRLTNKFLDKATQLRGLHGDQAFV